MNMLNMMAASGSLALLSLPLAYGLRTLIKLRSKKIYPIFRLIIVSKAPASTLADCVSREPGDGQVTSVF